MNTRGPSQRLWPRAPRPRLVLNVVALELSYSRRFLSVFGRQRSPVLAGRGVGATGDKKGVEVRERRIANKIQYNHPVTRYPDYYLVGKLLRIVNYRCLQYVDTKWGAAHRVILFFNIKVIESLAITWMWLLSIDSVLHVENVIMMWMGNCFTVNENFGVDLNKCAQYE